MPAAGAGAPEPEGAALRQALQLQRRQGRVGADQHDDRPALRQVPVREQQVLAQMTSHGRAQDGELVAHPEVRLHQDAQGVGMALDLEAARARARAPLELVGLHARPAADVALGHRAAARGVEGCQRVLLRDVAPADVVGGPVVGLGDDGHGPAMGAAEGVRIGVDHPAHRGVMHDADRMGVGEADRPLKITGVPHPVDAGHFAVAVQVELPGPHGQRHRMVAARQNRGHAGADLRPAAAAPGAQRREAHLHPRDVGDGVERAGRAGKAQTQIPCARFGHWHRILDCKMMNPIGHRPAARSLRQAAESAKAPQLSRTAAELNQYTTW